MYIFDSHVHIYPDKIAAKAAENIGNFYSLEMSFDGTISQLLQACDKAGVNRCLVHSVATTKEQVQKINDCGTYPQSFAYCIQFCPLRPVENFSLKSPVFATY